MPVLRIIENPLYRLGLYSLAGTGTAESLSLEDNDRQLFDSFTSDRRKREFLAVRSLLFQMTSGRGRIVYEDARKPLLEGFPGKISISHSASMVAVMISDLECGIDVEETSRNVDRIASRFLCQEELDWTAVSNNPAMARIVCWSAKEAIFKWAGISNTDFRRDIQIMPFPIAGQGSISAIHRSGDHISSLALNYFFELNNAVVWCVE